MKYALRPKSMDSLVVEATLGSSQGASANVEAAPVEAHHRDPEPFPLGADAVFDRDPNLV